MHKAEGRCWQFGRRSEEGCAGEGGGRFAFTDGPWHDSPHIIPAPGKEMCALASPSRRHMRAPMHPLHTLENLHRLSWLLKRR